MKKNVIPILILLFVGCSAGKILGQENKNTNHDVSGIKACELVKPAEVVKITGGKLLAEPSSQSASCMYVIEKNNDTFSYQIIFEPSEMVEAMLNYQSKEEKGEKIEGIWDEAYIRKNPLGEGLGLVAVWKGDFALEVKGADKTAIVEIAKLAASRVK